MGIHSLSGTTKRRLLTEVRVISNKILIKMAETVETTTPTVEEVKTPEVATNGEAEAAAPAETATETATNGTTEEPSSNGTTEEPATNGATEEATNGATEAESTNGATEAESTESSNGTTEAATEESSANGASEVESVEEASEASKRKADTPADEETVEKIAKLKEVAAEVVSEAEKDLPSEPLTEAEATA